MTKNFATLLRIHSLLSAIALCVAAYSVPANAAPFSLDTFQTVDETGLFPATEGGNIVKYDTSGTAHNAVAPFTTIVYVRAATSNVSRRTHLFLKFDLADLTAEQISRATLDFSAYSLNDIPNAVNNPDLFVSQLADDWSPDGLPDPLYDPELVGEPINAGGVTSGTGTDVYDSGEELTGAPTYRNITPYSIDVTSIVQNWQGEDANYGFHLQLGDSASHNQGIGIDPETLVLNVNQNPSPLVTLSTEKPTVTEAYAVAVAFSDTVTGLEATDFTVVNGTASALSGSGANYTVLITPTDHGDVQVTLPADSGTAEDGGLGNQVSNTLVTNFPVPAPPTVTLSTASPTVAAPYTVDVVFSEPVMGLEDSDFSVTNGTASDVTGEEDTYTVLITVATPGAVTVTLPAGSVADVNDGLDNLESGALVTMFNPAALTLGNMLNGDLNTLVPLIGGTGAGDASWSFDPLSNEVLFNEAPRGPGANEWVLSSLSRGFAYDPDGGAGGEGDGAMVNNPAGNFLQRPRAVHYFSDDDKQTTGSVEIGLDVLLDDATEENDLLLLVEIYAWNDDETAPLLSAGGAGANDPIYNLTEVGDAVELLNTQVLASEIGDAAWKTVQLGSVSLGSGYDNYVWRIGVLGETDGDIFAFDNVTVSRAQGLEITDIVYVLDPEDGLADVTITWKSGPNASYTVSASPDLSADLNLELADGVESTGDQTSYTEKDIDLLAAPVRYYRVVEE